ncbi:GAP family protein [Kineosporia sp. R_H_3]|uniref:GAP family protein n=1 Tax=Kineosporia sp. R_H_3 TaxID=1961848 RepID=UPI000B4AFA6F|nr:GAP family protein [Kineosporia sp. R_H_3]
MSLELAGLLVGLALVDSTSFGTLLVPVWLLLAPGRVRIARVLVYLAAVAGFYLALGLVLLAGAAVVGEPVRRFASSPPGYAAALAVGLLLVALGLWLEPLTDAGKRRRAARRGDGPSGPQRLLRWRDRVVAADASPRALLWLAVAAGAVEAVSMVPYLGALAALGASSADTLVRVAALAAYCGVMVLPALLLLLARVTLHGLVAGLLGRVDRWLTRTAGELTATVLFLLGAYLAAYGVDGLGWADVL